MKTLTLILLLSYQICAGQNPGNNLPIVSGDFMFNEYNIVPANSYTIQLDDSSKAILKEAERIIKEYKEQKELPPNHTRYLKQLAPGIDDGIMRYDIDPGLSPTIKPLQMINPRFYLPGYVPEPNNTYTVSITPDMIEWHNYMDLGVLEKYFKGNTSPTNSVTITSHKPLINLKLNWSIEIASSLLNGYFRGRHELMALKPWTLPEDCNPANTWRNKWRDGIPSHGEKFPGSSTIFVFLMDKYHRNSFYETITGTITTTSICISFYGKEFKGKKFWVNTLGRLAIGIIASDLTKTITMNYYTNK